jgi:hypothetical protein
MPTRRPCAPSEPKRERAAGHECRQRGRPGGKHGGAGMSQAADKLARTRLAIIDQIHRRSRNREGRRGGGDQDNETGGEWEESGRGAANWFAGFKRAATTWWRQHPASMGLELATPLLSEYAGKQPVRFLAVAAVVGATVVVARPWRLISATGLLVALLKSSQLSSLLMSAMSGAGYPEDRPPRK